ncbi:hypothetical protein ADP71_31400 [Vitreoscilla sp. C1]|uniref:hypothetical protein n=1 Tax=Vitreoscilla sp. (strain C1) TaxID=96942 RepID=UPI000CDCBF63|nr:hypothetical protein [Vitreoscilla sp. C1]AUZ06318.1 hypothetical protein ADP71_31400 [Vitreoscilla sp. C1]
MKKVWVNRFNHDGSMKPMREWELWRCGKSQTHTYTCGFGRSRDFDRDGLPLRNCFIDEQGRVSDAGCYFYEYIGDQRGDGWFYVADGDLPPSQLDDSLIVNVLFEKEGVLQSIPALSVHKHSKRIICWQPITPPKFL